MSIWVYFISTIDYNLKWHGIWTVGRYFCGGKRIQKFNINPWIVNDILGTSIYLVVKFSEILTPPPPHGQMWSFLANPHQDLPTPPSVNLNLHICNFFTFYVQKETVKFRREKVINKSWFGTTTVWSFREPPSLTTWYMDAPLCHIERPLLLYRPDVLCDWSKPWLDLE